MTITPLTRFILLATVTATGAGVLILEVLAVRLLSPHFGTSMYVLSSVLTIVLAALACGYYAGGRLSDRYPTPLPLYLILALGGLAIAFSYALAKVFLPFAPQLFPITTGPLILSLCLFFIPAFLLGMDSPYVIKLLTHGRDGATAGAETGTTFFWSTVGSIAGSLSAGFFFIPFVGIEATLLGVAVVLSLGAALAETFLRSTTIVPMPKVAKRQFLLIIAAATILLTIATFTMERPSKDGPGVTTIYEKDERYGHVRVYELAFSPLRPPARFLQREVNSESAIFQDSYEHPFEYTRFADLYPQLRHGTTTRALVLGGGAYSIPRSLLANNPDLLVDVAELDPALYPLAQTYFDLRVTPRLRNFVTDARLLINTADTTYDFIFMDTFNSGLYIPAHLTTLEYFAAVRERLSKDGLLMINFIGARDLPGTTLTDSFRTTLQAVFPNVQGFVARPEELHELQNIMFIADATDESLDVSGITVATNQRDDAPLTELQIPLTARDEAAQVLFTDDRSPAEYLVAKQLAAAKKAR